MKNKKLICLSLFVKNPMQTWQYCLYLSVFHSNQMETLPSSNIYYLPQWDCQFRIHYKFSATSWQAFCSFKPPCCIFHILQDTVRYHINLLFSLFLLVIYSLFIVFDCLSIYLFTLKTPIEVCTLHRRSKSISLGFFFKDFVFPH